jgi:spermidine synthase
MRLPMTRFAALVLTLVTGFGGLVYEVGWQKYLATPLGSHSEATAAVLAIFLGGLSAGYVLFGAATKRLVSRSESAGKPLRLLLLCALVYGSIGIYALAFSALFTFAQGISLLAPAGFSGFGFACDVVLSALLIGPPSILMGGTIPILTLALAPDLEERIGPLQPLAASR